ncbi:helix-turn-helix domain-containing protein [Brachybacterium paraconglomeratum]
MKSDTSVQGRRFLRLRDVQDILSISSAQAYALVRSGELCAIQIGGRSQWRVEDTELEAFIERSRFQLDASPRS